MMNAIILYFTAISGSGVADRLGASLRRRTHPASHIGAPTVTGLTDAYCPNHCSIWAWRTDTQEWVKDCVSAGWTVDGAYVYPDAMSCARPVTCENMDGDDRTEWSCTVGNNNRLGAASPRLGGPPASHDGAYIVQAGSHNLNSVFCDRDSQCPLWGWSPSDQRWYKVCVETGVSTDGEYVYPDAMSCSMVTCERGQGHYSEAEWQCENGNSNRLGAASPRLGGPPASHDGAYIVQAGSHNLNSVFCDRDSQCPLWGWSPSDQKWYKVCVETGVSTDGEYVYPDAMSCSMVTCERGQGHYSEAEWQCEYGNSNRLGGAY